MKACPFCAEAFSTEQFVCKHCGREMIADSRDIALERALMEEFLADQGLSFQDLPTLDDDQRQRLVVEAEAYAALRLGERAYRGTRGDLLL